MEDGVGKIKLWVVAVLMLVVVGGPASAQQHGPASRLSSKRGVRSWHQVYEYLDTRTRGVE